jgi:transposase-like protein
MLGFKSFRSAAVTLAGIELMHMIRKGQLQTTGDVSRGRLKVCYTDGAKPDRP